jgi:hypothetical protein
MRTYPGDEELLITECGARFIPKSMKEEIFDVIFDPCRSICFKVLDSYHQIFFEKMVYASSITFMPCCVCPNNGVIIAETNTGQKWIANVL